MKEIRLFSNHTFILLLFVSGIGYFIQQNPLLFGGSLQKVENIQDFHIYTSHPIIDAVLDKHRIEFGDDYIRYKNHCLRVLTFAIYHLKQKEQKQEINQHTIDLLALAMAYHDIALWTDKALNYLEPSATIMEKDILERRKQQDVLHEEEDNIPFATIPVLTDKEINIVKEIILQHHKVTEWKMMANDNDNEYIQDLVNAVRKGDWADATSGMVRFGLPNTHLLATYHALPDEGFHNMLLGMGHKLSPNSILGQMDVLKILKW